MARYDMVGRWGFLSIFRPMNNCCDFCVDKTPNQITSLRHRAASPGTIFTAMKNPIEIAPPPHPTNRKQTRLLLAIPTGTQTNPSVRICPINPQEFHHALITRQATATPHFRACTSHIDHHTKLYILPSPPPFSLLFFFFFFPPHRQYFIESFL